MTAEQALQDGNLDEALAQLQQEVRTKPADAKLRIFLFQLYAVVGQWERSLTQLNVAGELDAGALAMVQTYREALRCEALREAVFAGVRSPLVFGKPDPWVALLIQALVLSAEGKFDESQRVRAQAFEQAPTTAGSINGQSFSWIADADERLGPIIEAVVNGRYYWIPIDRINTLNVDEPEDLRDLVWAPAHFKWANGGDAVGLIPSRYPGSELSENNDFRLARRTEWLEHERGLFTGLGQRMLATDSGEYPLLDARSIVLDTAQGGAGDTEVQPTAAET